jgi:NTP pyrophosphatase (non-canonical NTP hydrolase)
MNYDDFVESTWLESDSTEIELSRCALGLAGEAVEVAEIIKKFLRGDGLLDQQQLRSELGDVLYYLTVFAHRMGSTLEDIQRDNVRKLESRKARGVIKGSGNDR